MNGDLDTAFGKDEATKKESKWNIFSFPDELLRWIGISSNAFFVRDYSAAFEGLKNLYFESMGFFDSDDVKELDGLYEDCLEKNNAHNRKYVSNQIQRNNQSNYISSDYYTALDKFRRKLMICLTNKNILLKMEKKGFEGAGSQ